MLADKIWKGSRVQELEDFLTAKIAEQTKIPAWEAFFALDEIIQNIAKDAYDRLFISESVRVKKTGQVSLQNNLIRRQNRGSFKAFYGELLWKKQNRKSF